MLIIMDHTASELYSAECFNYLRFFLIIIIITEALRHQDGRKLCKLNMEEREFHSAIVSSFSGGRHGNSESGSF